MISTFFNSLLTLNLSQILLFFLLIHILSTSRNLYRYLFELDFHTKNHEMILKIIFSFLPVAIMISLRSDNFSLLGLYFIFSLLRYIHIDRRYKSIVEEQGENRAITSFVFLYSL